MSVWFKPGDVVWCKGHNPMLWDRPKNAGFTVGRLQPTHVAFVIATSDALSTQVLLLASGVVGWVFTGYLAKL